MDNLSCGDAIEGYTIKRKISSGSFGVVYDCSDASGDAFALKVAKFDSSVNCQGEDELCMLSRLSHPNIVKCRASWSHSSARTRYLPEYVQGKPVLRGQNGEFTVDNSELQSPADSLGYRASHDLEDRTDDSAVWGSVVRGELSNGWLQVELSSALPCLVMDLWHCDLLDALPKAGLPEEAVRRLGVQMTDALAYLHSRGIVHRDIKAENFLVSCSELASTSCSVALADFGFATTLRVGQRHNEQCGNPLYWAPEIYDQDYGMKVDVWALGVIFCVLLDTHFPFASEAEARKEPLVLGSQAPELREFVEQLLHKKEELRLDSAEAYLWLTGASKSLARSSPLVPVVGLESEVEIIDQSHFTLFCQCMPKC